MEDNVNVGRVPAGACDGNRANLRWGAVPAHDRKAGEEAWNARRREEGCGSGGEAVDAAGRRLRMEVDDEGEGES